MIAVITSKLGVILSAIGAVILLLLGAFFKGRKSKHNEVQAKTAESVIKTAKKGKAIETDNRNSGADARRERLRKYSSDSE